MVEHLRQFHAQAGELVDVEEAAIIDVVGGDAEMRRAPVLVRGSGRRAWPGCRSAGSPPRRWPAAPRRRHGQACRAPPSNPWRGGRSADANPAGRKRHRPSARARDARRRGCASSAAEQIGSLCDRRPTPRNRRWRGRSGERAFPPPARCRTGRRETEPAACRAGRAWSGSQSMSNQPAYSESLAPFEHVEPPRIVGAADAHVVGHEIEDLAETVFGEGRDHPVEIGLVAEFGVEWPMVDDVVAVGAAGPRLQIGRGVDVADPEPREIRGEPRRIRKAKPLVKLQTVGGAWNHMWNHLLYGDPLRRARYGWRRSSSGSGSTELSSDWSTPDASGADVSSEPGLPRQSTCEPLTHRSHRSSGEFPTWIAESGEIT